MADAERSNFELAAEMAAAAAGMPIAGLPAPKIRVVEQMLRVCEGCWNRNQSGKLTIPTSQIKTKALRFS